MKKIVLCILGFVCLGLGCLGIVLPILPTVPFFLVTLYCFTASSEKLHDWFVSTDLYHNNLESYVNGEGMTKSTKRKILGLVTVLMFIGFAMMIRKGLYIPCAVLSAVWIGHIVWFGFKVTTLEEKE